MPHDVWMVIELLQADVSFSLQIERTFAEYFVFLSKP